MNERGRRAGSRAGWRGAALGLSASILAGCPFAPAIPVEESPPNFPPLISEEFIAPASSTVNIVRSAPQVNFSVNQIFDMNSDEEIEIVWFSPHVLGGTILQTELAGPDPNNRSLFRGLFHRYTGSTYTLDPCDLRWSDDERHTLSVFISDGNITVPAGEPQVSEGAFLDVHSWSVEFTDSCPDI